MQKHFLKFGKVFTNVALPPLILILNNSELAAKYLTTDVDLSRKTLEILPMALYVNKRLLNLELSYQNH